MAAREGRQAQGARRDVGEALQNSSDVPTMAEAALPGYEVSSWQALFAPAGTPHAIVMRLHAEVAKILKQPEVTAKLLDLGAEPGGMAPEELAALIKAEIPRPGKVVRDSGATVD